MNYKDLIEFDTKLTADVVEWRPLESSNSQNSNILACATYYLDKELNQRLGNLYMLEMSQDKNSVQVINSLNYATSGILDFKWISHDNLVTIDSNNNLKLLNFDQENSLIKEIEQISPSQNSIGLTLDFKKNNDASFKILSSDTLGYLNLVNIDNQQFNPVKNFKAHDLEVWSVLIDKNDDNIIYSGADDCVLKMWDLREPDHKQSGQCKVFEGGICSIILPQRNDANLTCLNGYSTNNILCGSYDERIYVLDKRNLKKSLNQSEKLDGGVWKMKLHSNKNLFVCACMHTGLHVINSESLKSELYYDKHGVNNLAYGCDWKPSIGSLNPKSDIIASCSFYNHELRIWELFY